MTTTLSREPTPARQAPSRSVCGHHKPATKCRNVWRRVALREREVCRIDQQCTRSGRDVPRAQSVRAASKRRTMRVFYRMPSASTTRASAQRAPKQPSRCVLPYTATAKENMHAADRARAHVVDGRNRRRATCGVRGDSVRLCQGVIERPARPREPANQQQRRTKGGERRTKGGEGRRPSRNGDEPPCGPLLCYAMLLWRPHRRDAHEAILVDARQGAAHSTARYSMAWYSMA